MFYNGNEVLNDAAKRGDLATVQRMIADESDWNRWQAAMQAWNSQQWDVVDALLDAGVGEQGRNALLEMTVSSGVVEWTERLLRDGTNEKARGFALNRLAEWQREAGDRPAELVEDHPVEESADAKPQVHRHEHRAEDDADVAPVGHVGGDRRRQGRCRARRRSPRVFARVVGRRRY